MNRLRDGTFWAWDISAWPWVSPRIGAASKVSAPDAVGGRALRLISPTTLSCWVSQNLPGIGLTRLTGWARSTGSTHYPKILFDWATVWTGTTSTDWQPINVLLPCNSARNWAVTLADSANDHAANGYGVEFAGLMVEPFGGLIADGDMETPGVVLWQPINGAILTKTTDDPAPGANYSLRIAKLAGGNYYPCARQTPPLIIGHIYRAQYWSRSDGVGYTVVWFGNGTVGQVKRTTNWTIHEYVAVCYPGTYFQIGASISVAGEGWVEYGPITVTDLSAAAAYNRAHKR